MCVLFVRMVDRGNYVIGDVIQVFEDGYNFGGRSDFSFEPNAKVVRLNGQPSSAYKRLEEVQREPLSNSASKSFLLKDPKIRLLMCHRQIDLGSKIKRRRRYSYLNSQIIDKGINDAS